MQREVIIVRIIEQVKGGRHMHRRQSIEMVGIHRSIQFLPITLYLFTIAKIPIMPFAFENKVQNKTDKTLMPHRYGGPGIALSNLQTASLWT